MSTWTMDGGRAGLRYEYSTKAVNCPGGTRWNGATGVAPRRRAAAARPTPAETSASLAAHERARASESYPSPTREAAGAHGSPQHSSRRPTNARPSAARFVATTVPRTTDTPGKSNKHGATSRPVGPTPPPFAPSA